MADAEIFLSFMYTRSCKMYNIIIEEYLMTFSNKFEIKFSNHKNLKKDLYSYL